MATKEVTKTTDTTTSTNNAYTKRKNITFELDKLEKVQMLASFPNKFGAENTCDYIKAIVDKHLNDEKTKETLKILKETRDKINALNTSASK